MFKSAEILKTRTVSVIIILKDLVTIVNYLEEKQNCSFIYI